jgi:hypothetical protein
MQSDHQTLNLTKRSYPLHQTKHRAIKFTELSKNHRRLNKGQWQEVFGWLPHWLWLKGLWQKTITNHRQTERRKELKSRSSTATVSCTNSSNPTLQKSPTRTKPQRGKRCMFSTTRTVHSSQFKVQSSVRQSVLKQSRPKALSNWTIQIWS